jgi:transcriptional regulator GlxA family with amidase domain
MAANLARDLSIDLLAERVAMSPRNFSRRFVEAMKVTPRQYTEMLRIDAARRLLTDGNAPVSRVAARCGFASEEAMRQAFQRHLNVAPSEFRERFRSAGD